MLAAQLQHKVPLEFESMEDVLTSSVFALLRYLPASVASGLLARWADIPVQVGPLTVDFWPRYATPQSFGIFLEFDSWDELPDRGESEPDVIIRSEQWLVLVEVKYQSSLDAAYDQLGREFAIGHQLADEEGRCFRLLVLTADVLPPTPGGVDLVSGVEQTLMQVCGHSDEVPEELIADVPASLRWIGWRHIYKTLARAAKRRDVAPHNQRLLEDGCRLLALRGLRPYSTERLRRAMHRWYRAAIPDAEWRSPMPPIHQARAHAPDGEEVGSGSTLIVSEESHR